MSQCQWYHCGAGAPTIFRLYFSGDWDAHWGYDLAFDPWPFNIIWHSLERNPPADSRFYPICRTIPQRWPTTFGYCPVPEETSRCFMKTSSHPLSRVVCVCGFMKRAWSPGSDAWRHLRPTKVHWMFLSPRLLLLQTLGPTWCLHVSPKSYVISG